MIFDEVRLPEDIETGATGGPEFNTTVTRLDSGVEERNANWLYSLSSYDIGYGVQKQEGYQRILTFFNTRQGRLRAFRFRDFLDFEGTNEFIANADGSQTQFQLIKTYEDSANTYIRLIQKPVADSVVVFVAGVENTDATVDVTTGVITFPSAPTGLITATYEFDVPVRFSEDSIDVSLDFIEAGQVPNLPIEEVRLPLASLS